MLLSLDKPFESLQSVAKIQMVGGLSTEADYVTVATVSANCVVTRSTWCGQKRLSSCPFDQTMEHSMQTYHMLHMTSTRSEQRPLNAAPCSSCFAYVAEACAQPRLSRRRAATVPARRSHKCAHDTTFNGICTNLLGEALVSYGSAGRLGHASSRAHTRHGEHDRACCEHISSLSARHGPYQDKHRISVRLPLRPLRYRALDYLRLLCEATEELHLYLPCNLVACAPRTIAPHLSHSTGVYVLR